MTSRSTLAAAWARVRANRGGAGGDGITLEDYTECLERNLRCLSADLRCGTYRPGPLRRVALHRPGGRIRLLRIPAISDRIVQTACYRALSARLDPRMSADSFGYRPARSVEHALARVRQLAREGCRWALDADIEKFFDRVPHERLMDEFAIWIDDARVIALVQSWLAGFGGSRGLAQGAPISPLLANLYLHPLDRALSGAAIAMVRYADDFVALTPTEAGARRAHQVAAATLRRRGLRLHPAKTRLVRLSEGFEFLGQRVVWVPGVPKPRQRCGS